MGFTSYVSLVVYCIGSRGHDGDTIGRFTANFTVFRETLKQVLAPVMSQRNRQSSSSFASQAITHGCCIFELYALPLQHVVIS